LPTAATVAGPGQTNSASGASSKQAQAPRPVVPFTRAAKEHIEPFVDVSQVLDANTHALGPFDVPAYGYLRHLVILVQTSGFTSTGAVVATEDAPWIAISDIQLADVNGAPIVGPLSGYDLYLINKYGSYEYANDPKTLRSFSAVQLTTGAGAGGFAFSLQIPVELNIRDALGAIANQNASSTYKLKPTINASTALYTTAPTTLGTVRFRAYLKAWSQPPASDLRGNPQATTPPAHGTTQYWSKFSVTPNSGSNTIRFVRVGNYIRQLILVNRDTANGTRATGETDFPDPSQWFWDTRLLHNYTKIVFQDEITRRTGFVNAVETTEGEDNGVFIYDWCHEFDGHIGHELRDGWLPSVQSTRLEVQGSWAANSKMDVLTNDVAPAGQVFL
jgi:hypothetical protein